MMNRKKLEEDMNQLEEKLKTADKTVKRHTDYDLLMAAYSVLCILATELEKRRRDDE